MGKKKPERGLFIFLTPFEWESQPTEDKSQHSRSVLKGPAQIRTYLGLERQHRAVWETYGEAQLTLMCGGGEMSRQLVLTDSC